MSTPIQENSSTTSTKQIASTIAFLQKPNRALGINGQNALVKDASLDEVKQLKSSPVVSLYPPFLYTVFILDFDHCHTL
ncbi:MAG: hypothetical protein CK426_02855 [Legionella sp.]|nr:MAG: hypothetical protein CK423_07590 [Legionella sp.]PJD99391.1 MAG: hypothetical protein CK426_02855 [Legionella sp.]